MEQESWGLTKLCYCVGLHVLIINAVLTRQTVQLLSACCHDDVILHDVCHLVLQVLLIECDQGIRAGIPNLNKRLIMPAVYKSVLECISLYLYMAGHKSATSLSWTHQSCELLSEVGTACINQTQSDEGHQHHSGRAADSTLVEPSEVEEPSDIFVMWILQTLETQITNDMFVDIKRESIFIRNQTWQSEI